MHKRLPLFWVLFFVFIISIPILWLASSRLIQRQILDIEHTDMQSETKALVAAPTDEIEHLSTIVVDWSSWDDSYNFTNDQNQAYIDSNFTNETFVNLGINYIAIYDSTGKQIVSKGVDSNGKDIVIPEDLINSLKQPSSLLASSDESSHSGLLRTQGDPLIIVTRPILNSQGIGPFMGTMVFAKTLTKAIYKAPVTDFEFSYNYIDAPNKPADIPATYHLSSDKVYVDVLSSKMIGGYQILNDVFGQPLLVARNLQQRTIYQESIRALTYYLLICTSLVSAATVASFLVTRQLAKRDQVIKLKDEFFSIASHELRTPLTAIKGNSKMLSTMYKQVTEEEAQQMLADIYTSSDRLIHLVTNFLDIARLERNAIPINITPVNLQKVIGAVIEEMHTMASDGDVALTSTVSEDVPLVAADADRVKQVIYNITGNALKFTSGGSVTISAETQLNKIVVRISDTGRGIPPESQSNLFTSYKQVKATDATKGTGLGLYISRLFIEKMGGIIYIESSTPERGTTIAFTLPIAKTTPLPQAPAN